MSLRDELLKAGLVSADKAKKQASDDRKQDHQRKKNKALAAEDAARQAEARRQAETEAARKRERDRQLNLEREAEKRQREGVTRARQLIDSHRVNEPDAEIPYNFLDSDGHWIRLIRVTPTQRKGLAMGRLAIVRGDRHAFDFALAPRETADKLREFAPERVILLHTESENQEDDFQEI
ncbi:MAG: DUF2058 family protein [Candidatus Competibacteraceae bacterium]|nr:DUF2058 family protein [Candidatus Competibacteraceae bacterium]HRY14930.1 DUF2058 family protein [Candidatus Competibacteraceae bacterium]